MIPPLHSEPGRDERIGEALRASDPAAAVSHSGGDDAVALRIVQAAAPQLSRLRTVRRPWWEWTAEWARIAVPVGLAATIVAGALLLTADEPVDPVALGESALVLDDGAGGSGLAAELVPAVSDEWLLAQVYER